MKFRKKSTDENSVVYGSKKNNKLLSAVVATVLILCCVLGILFGGGFESIDYYLFYRHNVIDSAVSSTGNFTVSFANNDIISCEKISSKVVVLTKKMLSCVSYKGRVLFTETFTFVEPQMYVNDRYGIVFDRGSSKYILFDSYGVIRQGTTDENRHIITAVTDKKGNCAISTKSDDSACRVYYLDKKGNTKYIWSCAEEYVVSLDISNDGNDLLCGALGSFNDEIYTNVYYLDTRTKRPEKSYKIKGSACIGVSFRDSNSAVTDCLDKRIILDFRADEGCVSESIYSGNILRSDTDDNNNFVVVTDVPTADGGKEVTLYDKNNTLVFRTTVPENVSDVLCNGNDVYCLTEEGIFAYDLSGKCDNFACSVIGKGLVPIRGGVCYYSSGRLIKAF